MKSYMKKLILVLFTTILSCNNFYGMDPDPANIGQIKTTIAMLYQEQERLHQYEQVQSNILKDQTDFIKKIADFQIQVEQETYDIKSYDFLIENQDLLTTASIQQELPFYPFLLLSKEYLASHESMTPGHKNDILNKIRSLLPYHYDLFHQEMELYDCTNLQNIPDFMKAVYKKSWTMHKNVIESQLTMHEMMAKGNKKNITMQLFQNQHAQVALAQQIEQYDRMLISMLQEKDSYRQAPIVVEQAAPVLVPTSIKSIIENIQAHADSRKTEKAVTIIESMIAHADKKTPQLSKKQIVAQAAAKKRAEQSTIDKERHRAHVQKQEEAKEQTCTDQLRPSHTKAAVLLAGHLSTKTGSKSTPKKSAKKHSVQTVIDEDAFLDAEIAKNQCNSTQKKHDKVEQPSEETLQTRKKTVGKNQEWFYFDQFIQGRNKKILELEQAKEVQRKINLKKLCSVKKEDRDRVKNDFEKALSENFSIMDEDEENILRLFDAYAMMLDAKNIRHITLEKFLGAQKSIVSCQTYLQTKGVDIKWYLAAYPDRYKNMKDQFIKFKTIMAASIEHEENIKKEHPSFADMESPLHKEFAMLQALQTFHWNDGILDISRLIHQVKPSHEVNSLGTLHADAIEKTGEKIQLLHQSSEKNGWTQALIDELLAQANITTEPANFADQIIQSFATILSYKTVLPADKEKLLYSDLLPQVFYDLQRYNEICIEPSTESQLADMAKIHVAVVSMLLNNESL